MRLKIYACVVKLFDQEVIFSNEFTFNNKLKILINCSFTP